MVDMSELLTSVQTVGSWELRWEGWRRPRSEELLGKTRRRNCRQTPEDPTEAGSIPEPRSEGRSLTSEVLWSGS